MNYVTHIRVFITNELSIIFQDHIYIHTIRVSMCLSFRSILLFVFHFFKKHQIYNYNIVITFFSIHRWFLFSFVFYLAKYRWFDDKQEFNFEFNFSI